MRKKLATRLIGIDVGILLCSVAFFALTQWLSGGTDSCAVHRILRLYCPACGGTRAAKALLRGEILTSLSLFPPLILAVLIGIELHVRAGIAFVRKDWTPLSHYPKSRWIILGASVVLWFLLRNLLLIVWKMDLSGDFLPR